MSDALDKMFNNLENEKIQNNIGELIIENLDDGSVEGMDYIKHGLDIGVFSHNDNDSREKK